MVERILGRRPKILVVDDQPAIIQSIHQLFREDYQVFMATDGHTAVQVCKRERPDLILLDIVMPGENGFDVCLRLKASQDTRDVAIIFVTSHNAPDDETRGLEAGAVDFVSKPINPSVVRARVRTHLTLKAQADRLRGLAQTDELTGIFNRRRFAEHLEIEWRACRRAASPLAVLLLDVDHFKAFNDHYGHQAGDAALREVAQCLRSALRRPRDFLARYGGEEFVCVLTDVDPEGAIRAGEYLRAAINRLALPHAASGVAPHVTVSVGAASVVPGREQVASALVAQADADLYEAKRKGRNRVSPTCPPTP